MAKIIERKQANLLITMCVLVYFFSYITRVNYAAIIVELVAKNIATKPQTALVTTVAFITYGIGQLISGYLGDRFSPRWLIFFGYLLTVTMNFLMPVFSFSFLAMSVLWGINGIAHAFMWPPLVKIMTSALSGEDYARAVPLIGMGSASATIVIYILSPIIIKFLSWEFVFYIFASATFIAAFLWILVTNRLLKNVDMNLTVKKRNIKPIVQENNKDLKIANILLSFLPIIIFSIALQGILRDGISTWLPTFMSETFNMASTVSIITAVGLPVFHLINNILTVKLLKKLKNDVFKTITIYFGVIGAFFVILYLFGINYMWMALLLISVANGMVYGINLLQTGYIPKFFIQKGSVSTISGIINFATYIGSAASTYLFAVISEKFGWNTTVLSWIIFALSGAMISGFICFVLKRKGGEDIDKQN